MNERQSLERVTTPPPRYVIDYVNEQSMDKVSERTMSISGHFTGCPVEPGKRVFVLNSYTPVDKTSHIRKSLFLSSTKTLCSFRAASISPLR